MAATNSAINKRMYQFSIAKSLHPKMYSQFPRKLMIQYSYCVINTVRLLLNIILNTSASQQAAQDLAILSIAILQYKVI